MVHRIGSPELVVLHVHRTLHDVVVARCIARIATEHVEGVYLVVQYAYAALVQPIFGAKEALVYLVVERDGEFMAIFRVVAAQLLLHVVGTGGCLGLGGELFGHPFHKRCDVYLIVVLIEVRLVVAVVQAVFAEEIHDILLLIADLLHGLPVLLAHLPLLFVLVGVQFGVALKHGVVVEVFGEGIEQDAIATVGGQVVLVTQRLHQGLQLVLRRVYHGNDAAVVIDRLQRRGFCRQVVGRDDGQPCRQEVGGCGELLVQHGSKVFVHTADGSIDEDGHVVAPPVLEHGDVWNLLTVCYTTVIVVLFCARCQAQHHRQGEHPEFEESLFHFDRCFIIRLQIYNFFCKVVAIYIKILPVATFYGQGMVELIDSQSAGSVYQRYF